jgi:hypothetical protein
VWEFIFLMLVLKLPIVYLCAVVWWAIKAEPKPPEPAFALVPEEPSPWSPRRRPTRRLGGPHAASGRLARRAERVPTALTARARR